MPSLPYLSPSRQPGQVSDLSLSEKLAGGYLESGRFRLVGRMRLITAFLLLCLFPPLFADDADQKFYFRGNFYLDWYGTSFEDTEFYHQLSSRLKLDLLNRRGEGWNLLLDTRNRTRLSEEGRNHLILYDARLSFEKPQSPVFLSLGQMNLYDTAGIGQLLGGLLGFKPRSDLLVGGYAGLESSVYINRVDSDYKKFGVFARYTGNLGKRFSLSYNLVRYAGMTERQYVYFGSLFPVKKYVIFYGNFEYELASNVQRDDRLSRIFLNVRFDPWEYVDVTAHYSSGRGLDFHRYALEVSQNPTLNDPELEHYYYTRHYGLRLSLKPRKWIRLFVSRRESEQRDDEIRNHSWRFGFSVLNLFQTGLSIYGSYTINRGEISESDSYYISLTKDFGRVSWSVSISNTFNSIRFSSSGSTPQIIHLDDSKTITSDLFIPINRAVAVSLQYEYFIQEDANQNLFFVRLMLRK